MNRLHELIRRLPVGVEFLVVVTLAFGRFIIASILAVSDEPKSVAFTNEALLSLFITELLYFGFLVWFLKVRGWTLEKFGLRVTWRGMGGGILLAAASYLLFLGAQWLAHWVLPIDMQAAQNLYPKVAPNLDRQLIYIVSVFNGVYEELFVAGYIITVLTAARGMWTAINVSTVVRLLYHLYQGPIGIITVVPLGLVYGYLYARTRSLWPLIAAHIIIDIVGLSLATR